MVLNTVDNNILFIVNEDVFLCGRTLLRPIREVLVSNLGLEDSYPTGFH
jgi:hypothetical protein